MIKNIITKNNKKYLNTRLPIKLNLNFVYINTIILVIIVLGVSIIGILFQHNLYPTYELSVGFVSNDILNLIVGIPIILITMVSAKRGNLIGLLCYPGALFYITYVYTTYLLGLPFNVLFIPYLFLVTVSIYTIIILIVSIDYDQVHQKIKGYVPIKTSGAILFTLASLMIIYQTYSIILALINKSNVDQLMIAQWIVDLVFASPPVIIIGYFMMYRKALGYTLGISLLLFLSSLFIGVVPVLIIEAIRANSPIDVKGIIIVLISSMVCIIPLLFFVKGINKAIKRESNNI